MRLIFPFLSVRSALLLAAVALVALPGAFASADDPLLAPSASVGYQAPNVAGSATDWHDLGTEATASAWGVAGRLSSGNLRVDDPQGFVTLGYTGIKWGNANGPWTTQQSVLAGKDGITQRGGGVVEQATVTDAGFEDTVTIPSSGGTGKIRLYGKLTMPLEIERTFDGDSTATVFTTDGPITLVNGQGDRVLGIGTTRAFDAAGQVHDCDVQYTKVADGFTFIVTVPATWLGGAIYPIRIDPIIGKPEAISKESARADFESQCAFGAGQYFVVWTSKATAAIAVSALTTSGEDVYARRVAPDGTFIGPTFAVATGSTLQRKPHVAFASAGGGVFGVALRDGNLIVFKRYSSTGALLSVSTINDPALSNRVTTVDIASNGTDRFCITWTGFLAGSTFHQTWAEVRGADGSVITGDTAVGPSSGTTIHARPSVVWNATLSQWFFTWEGYDGAIAAAPKQVSGRAFDATLGSAAFAEILVSTDPGSNYDARIAWSATSNEYLVTFDNNPPTGKTNVHGRRVRATDGVLLASEFSVETNTKASSDSSVAWIPNSNRWVAVFDLAGGGMRGAYGQALMADGTPTGPLFVLSDDPEFGEIQPTLAHNGGLDQFLATWTDGSATVQDIWGARLDLTPPVAPGPITTSNTSSAITLTWPKGTESDLATYEVYRSTVSGIGYVLKASFAAPGTSTVTWDDTTAVPNTRYYYAVRAIDTHANTSDNSTEASETIDTIPPAAPTGLGGTAHSASVALTWTANIEPDIFGYNAYYRTTGSSIWTKANVGLIATAAFMVTGLTNGTSYDFAVSAVDTDVNESALSSTVLATPLSSATPPASPVGLLGVAGPGQVTLSWTANAEPDIAGYNVYYRTTGGPTWTKHNFAPIVGTSDTITGLTPFSFYDLAVTAVNTAALESAFSETIVARAGVVPPAMAPGVTATPGTHRVVLTWTASTGLDIVGYDVFRSLTASGTYHRLNSTPITALTYTDLGLTNGTTYFYRVAAVQAAIGVDGTFSPPASATPGFTKPGTLTLISSTGTTATMSWGTVAEPDLAGYRVYRSITSGTGYSVLTPSPISPTSFTDLGLAAGTYYWVVTAVSTGGDESAYSNQVTATLSGVPTPGPPTLDASNVRKTNKNMPKITGAALPGYIINIYEGTTLLATVAADGTTGLFSVSSTLALADGQHVIQATQQVSGGDPASGYSSGRVVTIDTVAPATPTGLAVLAGDGWVNLQWNDNSEPDLLGYNVYRRGTGPGDPWVKLNDKPLVNALYVDRDVTNGTPYKYKVAALDDTSSEE